VKILVGLPLKGYKMKKVLMSIVLYLTACGDCGPNYKTGQYGLAPEPFSVTFLQENYPIGSTTLIYSSGDAVIGGSYLDPHIIYEVKILGYSQDHIKVQYINTMPSSSVSAIEWRHRRLFFPVNTIK